MKKVTLMLAALLLVIFLAACGQGENAIDSNESTGNIETEENADAVEEETEVEEEPAADESTEEESTEEPVEEEHGVEEETAAEDSESVETDETPAVEEATATPVYLFFADDQVMDIYKEERSIEASDEELFKATFEAWVEGPEHANLVSLIPSNVEVQSVEEHEGVAHVSFSSALLDAQLGSGTEAMLMQQIALTMKQFGFNQTKVLIDGEEHPEMFGHIDTSAAIEAENTEDIPTME
ncbi:GerMN domain-containing protein [Alkalihalophilus marmarensis]|uniref:GerMN domain-containing protein n=1 Tax=Alkalihalophilus marmarensis TaxID=521377 RepID=UPI002DBBEE82|nr:GerMN domain-containing protein [Alkalihalophilus marmarensis]MEC2071527.1 GerMN domain-containing protein [Alkalihalophilus marmarensis]